MYTNLHKKLGGMDEDKWKAGPGREGIEGENLVMDEDSINIIEGAVMWAKEVGGRDNLIFFLAACNHISIIDLAPSTSVIYIYIYVLL